MEDIRANQVQHIGDLLRARNIVLKGADALSVQGFTQVPNHMLKSPRITPGAKLAYTMLLSYAWQNDYCFPGQQRLGRDIGVSERSVRTYLQELEAKAFLTIMTQGVDAMEPEAKSELITAIQGFALHSGAAARKPRHCT